MGCARTEMRFGIAGRRIPGRIGTGRVMGGSRDGYPDGGVCRNLEGAPFLRQGVRLGSEFPIIHLVPAARAARRKPSTQKRLVRVNVGSFFAFCRRISAACADPSPPGQDLRVRPRFTPGGLPALCRYDVCGCLSDPLPHFFLDIISRHLCQSWELPESNLQTPVYSSGTPTSCGPSTFAHCFPHDGFLYTIMTIPPNPPFAALTPDNRGPAVIVAAYIFYTLAFVTVVTRCWNRFTVLRRLGWEDWVITICVLLAFAQTVALTFAINNGLGRSRDDLSEAKFLDFAKAYYVSELFAIPVLTLAKISTLMLIIAIQPPRAIVMVCRGTGILTIVWGLAMMFAIAFECSLPMPWNYEGQCGNHEMIRIITAVWNISTDLVLVALPITMMHNVHVNSLKRWTVNGLFGSRILYVTLSTLRSDQLLTCIVFLASLWLRSSHRILSGSQHPLT